MQCVKIFIRKGCPRCPMAKEVGASLEKEGIPVFQYDIDTVDGLAEASFRSVLSTPSLIVEDEHEREIAAWRGAVPTLQEVKRVLFRQTA